MPDVTYAEALEKVLSKGEPETPERWPPFVQLPKARMVQIHEHTRAWLWDDVGPYAPAQSVDDAESVLAIWYQTPSFTQRDRSAEVLTTPLGQAPAVRLLIDDHGDSYFVELAFLGEGDAGLLVTSRGRGGLNDLFGRKLLWTDLATWTLGDR